MKIPMLARLCALVLLPAFAWAYQPAGRFKTADQAKRHCPNDVVVWVTFSTKLFYLKGHLWYGNGPSGAYECRMEALEEGNLPG